MEFFDRVVLATALGPCKDLLKEVYCDLAKPGIVQFGKAIGEAFEGAFLPITEWKEKRKITMQRRMEAFRQQLERIPVDKIVAIPADLGVPVLEKLSYVQDDMISQLFLNLLTTAANEDTVNNAHPSFIRVIESLSSDEAKLLLEFREKSRVICRQVIHENTQAGVRKTYGKRYGRLEITPKMRFPQNIEVYLSNFVGLGIISRGGEEWLRELPESDEFFAEERQIYDAIEKEINRDTEPLENADGEVVIRETIYLTAYGNMFLDACVKNVEVATSTD